MGRKKQTPVNFSELGGYRYLHFGSEWIQGGMLINRPWKLALEYQQWMMSLMLFNDNPAECLQLGLGAGGFAKFCWKYMPNTHTTVVEISEEVYMASRMWFKMPDDDERLQVVFEDCKKYLKEQASALRPDWLLVDIYDAECWGPVYDDVPFYRLCRKCLSENGFATFNVFGGVDFLHSLEQVKKAFNGRVLHTPEVQEGNRILLAAAGPKRTWRLSTLKEKAKDIKSQYKLPADKWVNGLQNENNLSEEFIF